MEQLTPHDDAPTSPKTPTDAVTLRRVETQSEFEECVEIQEETWGAGFTERVPAAILRVSQKIGGVTAGAFMPSGRMVGFVFGMTGIKDGALAHWSDILAVRPEARRMGLGRRLKHYQRELLRPLGVRTMLWTFDPLVARNAHLNLVSLGARAIEYVQDMYGVATRSPLHGDLGTDRFVIEWALEGVASGGWGNDRSRTVDAPVVNAPDALGVPSIGELPDAPAVRVQVPDDLADVLARAPDVARQWRLTTRLAFLHYLGAGYHVAAFDEEGGKYYVLRRR